MINHESSEKRSHYRYKQRQGYNVWTKSLSEKCVTYDEFHIRQYAQPERVLRYYKPIVTFQHSLLTFRIGSKYLCMV